MAGRIYTSRTVASVAAVQDLVSLLPGSTKVIIIHEVVIGQTTSTTVGNLALSLKRLSGALTAGSGGSAPAIQKVNSGDAAATTTARANDTTQATGGTASIIRSEVYNPINTYQFLPPPEDRPIIGPGEQFVVSLDSAPASAQNTLVTITFEELP